MLCAFASAECRLFSRERDSPRSTGRKPALSLRIDDSSVISSAERFSQSQLFRGNLWIWRRKEGRYRVSPFRLRKCQSVCSTKIDGIRTSRTSRSHESPGYPSRYRSAPTDTWWSEISISNASHGGIFAAGRDSVLSNSQQIIHSRKVQSRETINYDFLRLRANGYSWHLIEPDWSYLTANLHISSCCYLLQCNFKVSSFLRRKTFVRSKLRIVGKRVRIEASLALTH